MPRKIVLKGKKPLINSQGCIKISSKAVESLTGLIKQTGMSASAIVSTIIVQVYENNLYEYVWDEEEGEE